MKDRCLEVFLGSRCLGNELLEKVAYANLLIARKNLLPESLMNPVNAQLPIRSAKYKSGLVIAFIIVGVIAELKNTWRKFMPKTGGMTPMQRFHYIMGAVMA